MNREPYVRPPKHGANTVYTARERFIVPYAETEQPQRLPRIARPVGDSALRAMTTPPRIWRGEQEGKLGRIEREQGERAAAVFAVPDSELGKEGVPRQFWRGTVTERSKAEAVTTFDHRLDDGVRALIYKYGGEGIGSADVATLVRENSELRLELGGHLLTKMQKMHDATETSRRERADQTIPSLLPPAVHANRQRKAPHIPGYDTELTNREYAAVLALSMLDATFKPENEDDNFARDARGNVTHDQHRYAAHLALSARGWM